MAQQVWWMLLVVFAAGALGGLVNALISDNGFLWPQKASQNGSTIVRPGMLGNALIGGVAAAISWGLYGPDSAIALFGSATAQAPIAPLTLSGFVGAILIGVSGAKWLTNEVDKSLLRAAATTAAAANRGTPNQISAIASSTPANALAEAMKL